MTDSDDQGTFKIFVDALSQLQDIDGSRESIHFPRIVTIGSQSAGKSSVLEAIVGRPFLPRGTDIVTRCPLRVRIHQIKDEEEYCIFDYNNNESAPSHKYFDFEEVSKEIERRTESKTNKTKNISKEEIHLDIFSPNHPGDLQFIDLPGFTKCPVKNQDDDIEQQIEDLNFSYMKEDNTIMLAIHDATQDIANSDAMKYALGKNFDLKGERSIGVLTKLDNLHSTTDKKRVADVLDNKTKPLTLGYVGVVNRSQHDIDEEADFENTDNTIKKVKDWSEFGRVKDKIGVDVLRRTIIKILAERVKKILPELKQKREDELKDVKEKLHYHGLDDTGEGNIGLLITQLVEKSINKIKINLQGYDTRVTSEELDTGANLNEIIKKGSIRSSESARTTFSVTEFKKLLEKSIRKVHAIRDNIFPVEIVLEVAVSMLTESYRGPFKKLLNDATEYLTKDIIKMLDDTLKPYPHFKDLVERILLQEIEKNKTKAEEYLDVQINIHKRFLNSEHPDFEALNKDLKEEGNGIRFKNHFNVWFQERIPNRGQEVQKTINEDVSEDNERDVADGFLNIGEKVAMGLGQPGVAMGLGAVRGFVTNLQKDKNDSKVHVNKLPSKPIHEATTHLDLALDYMEIVDKMLVNVIPKVYIMMLVMKFM